MNGEPAIANALCLDGGELTVDGDFAVVRNRAQAALAVWNIADGSLRASYTHRGGAYAVGGGRLFTMEFRDGDEALTLSARALRTGKVVSRRANVADDSYFPSGMRWRDGLLYLCSNTAVEILSVEDGASQATVRHDAEWVTVSGFSSRCVLVRDEDGPLRAFARRTLEPRWSMTDERHGSVVVDDGLVAVCAATPDAPGDATLRCLDPDSGRPVWTVAEPLHPLATTRALVLVADDHGWIVALDRDTGAARWKQWLDAPARELVATADGFAALTAEALVELTRDGAVVARRRRATTDLAAQLDFSAGRIVCTAALDASTQREARAPTTRDPPCAPVLPAFAWRDGASLHRPHTPDLDDARSVIASCDDLDEAWERLSVQGLVADDPDARAFVSESNATKVGPRPWSRGAMLSVASCWTSLVNAEALLRESLARAAPWGGVEVRAVPRWRVLTLGHPPPPRDDPWQASLRAVKGAVPREVIAAVERRAPFDATELSVWNSPWLAHAILGDALWRTADAHDLRVRGGAHDGARFSSCPNPFAPMCELLALGFSWTLTGDLVIARFDDELTALRIPDEDDIPF